MDEGTPQKMDEALLADRLLAVLRIEMRQLESLYEDFCPDGMSDDADEPPAASVAEDAPATTAKGVRRGSAKTKRAAPSTVAEGPVKAASARTVRRPAGGDLKGRIEAIGQMTRTLEKLLELKQLEALTMRGGGAEDDAETVRLREEMMKRLKAIDARRAVGSSLFAEVAGEPAAGI
ncbi:hypothetical protein [Consotaella salsifontis]|uniref:Uncharacterized protein n=1 Tax=Consotaella salsifontis TaxID=1365950 RepID=A0A1T4MEW0_9HYPH|nr:hypothetical protein [Consotaella salsifontis]SJZ65569.1 hypothetical protein SAMN05428963_10292 [Consotaella salsifontis]